MILAIITRLMFHLRQSFRPSSLGISAALADCRHVLPLQLVSRLTATSPMLTSSKRSLFNFCVCAAMAILSSGIQVTHWFRLLIQYREEHLFSAINDGRLPFRAAHRGASRRPRVAAEAEHRRRQPPIDFVPARRHIVTRRCRRSIAVVAFRHAAMALPLQDFDYIG